MKTNTKNIILIGLLLSGFIYHVQAQVQYNGCTITGTYSSAIGKNNKATGNNSFAAGYNSQSTGSNSFAFGYNSKATKSTTTAIGNAANASGVGSIAIGNYVTASGQNSFVFGTGATSNYPLTNETDNSIAFGTNSNKPTMLITKSLNNNYTGKVAIGQVSNPQTKLHIKSDNNEDAGVFIEPSNPNSYKAFIKLFDNNHGITVDKTENMVLNSGNGKLHFKGESYCFGSTNEKLIHIYTSDAPAFYVNAVRIGGREAQSGEGSSFAIDFHDDGMSFRSAAYQSPRGSEITNWETPLQLGTNGKITITGKVGINTVNNVDGYALAVDGGIVSTKVYIKEVKLWPDYVFDDNYSLLGLDELKDYLSDKRHLPGIPSNDEIVANGYDVQEMQVLMMEKIEEMARYILVLQDEINELKNQPTNPDDTIAFTYDNNGNRIARTLVFQKVENPRTAPQNSSHSTYELFPNPTPGEFTLLLKGQEQKPLQATLLTSNGVVLIEKTIENPQTSFDLSGQPNGVYLLEINDSDGSETWKIIKY